MARVDLCSHKARILSDEARYGRTELKELGIRPLVKY
jgi:hypothetical protein